METTTPNIRCLVACQGCRRQFDATGFAAGSRFHCACGEIIEVPRFHANDAAVVRCSSCSAPRSKGARSCQHCGADYTLHEQDLHTICPSCMTRVSDRARFCHHCATPIIVQGDAGRKTKHGCPACGRLHKMNGRSLGEPPISVLECPRCAGLWLSREGFEVVADRSRDRTLPDQVLRGNPAALRADTHPMAGKSGFYRQCPTCHKPMNRRNFGRRSGIVVDTCKEHGIWFDAQELGAILKWIRQGGEQRVKRQQQDEARHVERLERFKIDYPAQGDGRPAIQMKPSSSRLDGLGELLSALFEV